MLHKVATANNSPRIMIPIRYPVTLRGSGSIGLMGGVGGAIGRLSVSSKK